jgi:hypothetical protein
MPTVGSPVRAKQGLSTPSVILFVFSSLNQASQVLAIAQLTGKRTAPKRRLLVRPMAANYLKAGLMCLYALGISNNSVAQT